MEDIDMKRENKKFYAFIMTTSYNDNNDKKEIIYRDYISEDDALTRMKAEYFVQRERYESQGDAISESCLRPERRYGWLSTDSGIHIEMKVEMWS